LNKYSFESVNQFLLDKQHLNEDFKTDDIIQIVKDICALHATGTATPYISLFARAKNFRREHLDEELYLKKQLGKIRCMRGTIHILTKEMIPIAYAATRRMLQKGSNSFLEFRGVSTREYEAVSGKILEILKDREMTASEIKGVLKTELNVSAIVEQMCDQGLLIRSRPRKGWRDRVHKFCLFHDYFPDIDLTLIGESEARTLLVQRYLKSFGPTTENDIAWWIGLTKTETREALNNIEEQIVEVDVSDTQGSFLGLRPDEQPLRNMKTPERHTVNLLPILDPYLMGYKDRERYLSQRYQELVFDRSGNATTTILLDGRIVGVWDILEDKKPLVKLLLFDKIEQSVMKQVIYEARRIGKFIADKEVQVRECESMIPLTRRTAGGFMTPLRDSQSSTRTLT